MRRYPWRQFHELLTPPGADRPVIPPLFLPLEFVACLAADAIVRQLLGKYLIFPPLEHPPLPPVVSGRPLLELLGSDD